MNAATETLTRPAPVETVTPIKPSEAIRLGCLIAPVQAFGQYGHGPMACALGAMTLGYGADEFGYAMGIDGTVFNWSERIDRETGGCPACPAEYWSLPPLHDQPIVAHLNDDHRWSRERIADWLAEQGL